MILILFPTQLYEYKYLKQIIIKYSIFKIIIYEHPHYFFKFKYNKKKLLLHFSSLKCYYDYLNNKIKKYKNIKIEYIKYHRKLLSNKNYVIIDPVDKIDLPNKCNIIDSPNFLLSRKQLSSYNDRIKKSYIFYYFYKWSKKQLDIIPNIKSLDKDNRKVLKNKTMINSIKQPSRSKKYDKYIEYGIKRINKETKFTDNYGNVDDFIYPIDNHTAKKWLDHFLINKLKYFGDYQDMISSSNNFLYHSLLSSSINIGLINPLYMIKRILKKYNIKKQILTFKGKNIKIKLNCVEGFIRQLFWREYQRLCYLFIDYDKYINKPFFGIGKSISSHWYGYKKFNNLILDDNIKLAFDTGYLHHIIRLMVIGNYMLLSGVNPSDGFKWFMEFSCDSYEWIMYQNVYDMVFFVTGGKTTKRPYISSNNYLLKMSDYKKEDICDDFDILYDKFVKKNKNKLHKFRYYIRL